ncbi:uncharacterized protein [Amphiura filiformis]|uniref:uncharacterized protein n=1 Tax=Amphiura filiformis TaxID=82378 RepID=UPI003B21D062
MASNKSSYAENESKGTSSNDEKKRKSLATAYMVWFPLGIFGLHRMYLDHWFMGFLYMFTLGLYCGIGWIVDGFCLPNVVKETNAWAEEESRVHRPYSKSFYLINLNNMASNKSSSYAENGTSGNHLCEQKNKSLAMAYIFWFPLGIFGLHRMYLDHWFMGIVYMCTLGYFGIGWIVDGFCLPSIVKETNAGSEYEARCSGCSEAGLRYQPMLRSRTLRDAWILTLNPLGIIGIQHQYLGRPWYRLAYQLTAGLFLVGWVSDIFRMSTLVNQANAEIELLRSGTSMTEMKRQDIWDCKTIEAYIFGIPCGIFGMHHFYLGRYKYGFLYLFTLGLCFIGVIVDVVRMPTLVERANQERKGSVQ